MERFQLRCCSQLPAAIPVVQSHQVVPADDVAVHCDVVLEESVPQAFEQVRHVEQRSHILTTHSVATVLSAEKSVGLLVRGAHVTHIGHYCETSFLQLGDTLLQKLSLDLCLCRTCREKIAHTLFPSLCDATHLAP